MKPYQILIISICLLTLVAQNSLAQELRSPVDFVNPLMGTDSKPSLSNGNTYPCIGMPWGMNYWTPQTGKMGDGWQYSYSADKIVGFKQTHQPSPWMNDYGQFSIMPVRSLSNYTPEKRASWFTHKTETVTPYFYNVYLADANTTASFVPTERSAVFQFAFQGKDSAFLVVDAFDKGSYIKVIPSQQKIIGYTTRNSGSLPAGFKNYFVIYFNTPFLQSAIWSKEGLQQSFELTADHSGAVVGCKLPVNKTIEVRVASSFISFEQAELNLRTEAGNKTFDQLKTNGKKEWNKWLSRVTIEDESIENKKTFYSCLYRTLLFPQKQYEINAEHKIVHYSPYTGKTEEGHFYAGTGFWDTFRALYPLLNLLYPSISIEMQKGLLNAYKEGGWLPEWSSPGYRNIMIGNNSASVVAEAYIKGLRGYDIETLYKALIHGANNEGPVDAVGRKGVAYYNSIGYVPYDVQINENAARTLEYAYDDYAIAALGKALNKPQQEINLYLQRSRNYRNLFDDSTRLMRGRNKDGSFQYPFNPFKWGDAFTEGNSWHYTWSVFHDIEGLKQKMGGNESFVAMLDSVFAMPPVFDESYYGFVIHEIREMQIINMGQYAHGNQPIQHLLYLYNYAGQPWKSQYWIRQAIQRLYKPTPDGYCGDEDNGQTSAWYVFSALGFYPVCPVSTQYVLGSPLFKKAVLHLENGKKVEISAANQPSTNVYVSSLLINNRNWSKNWVDHFDLLKGASLQFTMSALPNKKRGTTSSDYPFSLTK